VSDALEDLTQHDILPQMEPARRPVEGPRIIALWVGIVALLAGGLFGAVYLAGEDAGTPEEAVQRMFDAIADEDALGVLEAVAPSERGPYRDSLPDMVDELKRLGILADDASLAKVKGVDLEFRDLRFTSKELGDGVSTVTIAGGTASYRVVPRELPLGDFITDLIGEDLPAEPQTGSDPVTTDDPESERIVTVKEDGSWYVSLHYSIAESMRLAAEAPLPKFGHGLQAKGESTPEKAVEAFLRASLGLDVQRAIELLPPDEARALRDYAPLFIDEAKQAAADSGFKASITSLDLDANRDGRHATVQLKRFSVAFDAGDASGTLSFDGKCVTIGGPDIAPDEGRICPEDQDAPAVITDLAGRLPSNGLVAVEQGGDWYVSPTRSVLESVVSVLKALHRSDLDALREFFVGVEESTAVG
jgi:hypothetical protein